MTTYTLTWADGREISSDAINVLCDADAEKDLIDMRKDVTIEVRND